MYDELVKQLRAEANEWCANCCYKQGGSICTAPDDRKKDCDIYTKLQAADAIEELQDALLLMVLQYCTTDDGLLYHSFMSAGENAFAALGLENGQQADPLWDMALIQKPPKEET